MNIRRPWVKLALLFALVAVASFLVPTTLAYVFDQTQPLVNTFAPNPAALTQAPVQVTVVKTVINTGTEEIGPEGFSFVLEDTITGETTTVQSNANGVANFALSFAAEDVGQPHLYKIYELDDHRVGVTYSTLVYTLQVDVTAVDNKPVANVLLNGQPTTNPAVQFENIYAAGQVGPPATGDNGQLTLYLVLMFASAGLILALYRKRGTR